jgi:hypothetical protein
VELESEGPSGEGPDDLNVFCDGIPTLVLADDPRCPNELVDVAGGTSGGAAGADETPPAGTGDGLVADTAEPTSLETPETSSQDELSDENVGSVEYAGVNVVAPRPLAEDSYPVGTGNQQLVESVDVGPIPERDEESAGGDDGERVEEEKEAEPRPPRVGGCSLGGVATGDGGWWAFGIVALAVFCGRSARRGSRR